MRVSRSRVARLRSSTATRCRSAVSSRRNAVLSRRLGRTANIRRVRIICIHRRYPQALRIGRYSAPDGINRRDTSKSPCRAALPRVAYPSPPDGEPIDALEMTYLSVLTRLIQQGSTQTCPLAHDRRSGHYRSAEGASWGAAAAPQAGAVSSVMISSFDSASRPHLKYPSPSLRYPISHTPIYPHSLGFVSERIRGLDGAP